MVDAPLCSFVMITGPDAGDDRSSRERTLDSLRRQTLGSWELLVAGEDPTNGEDPRIVALTTTGDRVLADAFGRARGHFVGVIEAGDLLQSDTLEWIASVPDEADLVYTDEDVVGPSGRPENAFYKPDWSPDRFRCQPYTGRLTLVRREAAVAVGSVRAGFGTAVEYDLALRVVELGGPVEHVPAALYHRARPAPVAAVAGERRAIAEHLERTAFPARVEPVPGHEHLHRLEPRLRHEPAVSIVIPTAGFTRMVYGTWMNLVTNCVASIVSETSYSDYEIICVIDDSTSPETRDELTRLGGDRLVLVPYSAPFNFSRKINVGALNARGEYLLLLNDDTEVITPDWLQSLVMYAQQPEVGAVGGKLLFADGRIQHAGVVAIHGDPGHAFYGFPRDFEGYGANVLVPANCLAVTGACLMSRRECFEEVGGLSMSFPLNYNDVDYCLKLWRAGYRVVFDPDVLLYHYESSSRITGEVEPQELRTLRSRWEHVLRADPYYNPNLRLPDFLPPLSFTFGRAAG